MGGAVGLGNLWRFPYIAGENGGGGFVLIYVGFVFLFGLPIMIAEMVIGRRGRRSAVNTMRQLIRDGGRSPLWHAIGWLSIVIPLVGLSYYAVVAAWSMDFLGQAVSGAFAGLDGETSGRNFGNRVGDPIRQTLLHAAFIALTAFVVGRGVHRGLERVARFMMPGLLMLLVGIVVYNVFRMDLAAAARFLFVPDLAAITTEGVLMALGQALFSLAVGTGMIITYAAYLPERVSLTRSATVVCAGDTLVAILAGLAIFPIVFGFGMDPQEGPPLIFVSLPVAFGQMPGGQVVGSAFFLLLFFAAFTTSVGMLEPSVSWLEEHRGARRGRVALAAGFVAWLVGLASVYSFNVLAGFFPLGFVDALNDKTIFDLIDFTVANVLLPLNALLVALFVGWSLQDVSTLRDLGTRDNLWFGYWRIALKYLVPIAIAMIVFDLWR